MRYEDIPTLVRKYVVEDRLIVDSYFAALRGGHFSNASTGEEYASSVHSVPYCKNLGIRCLLEAVDPVAGADTFDMLGGSGQISIAATQYRLCGFADSIITADIEIDQVNRALARGLPAIPLDLTDPRVIRSSSVQHLLYAYGFHHLSPNARNDAIIEAQKMLKPGGTAVFYDGIIGSSTERISTLLVDRLSDYPHSYPHPTIEQITDGVRAAGLELRGIYRIFDPQIFLSASDDQARHVAVQYYSRHYAIKSLSWEQLLGHLMTAYRSSNPIDAQWPSAAWQDLADLLPWNEIYSGPAIVDLLRAAFPQGCDTIDESWEKWVVIPREGVAVICSKPG